MRTPRPAITSVLMAPDAGVMGLGHVARCLALGQALRTLDCRVQFALTDIVAERLVRSSGFSCRTDFEDSWDVVIIDSYTRPRLLLRRLRSKATAVVAIDDLHRFKSGEVDLLLRPSLGERSATRILGGPRYALLRREYWRRRPFVVRPLVSRVLVVLGAYPRPETLRQTIDVVREQLPRVQVDAVVGSAAVTGMQEAARGLRLWAGIPSLLPLFHRADVVITAGGQTLCEALTVGVPSIVLGTAANQLHNLRGVEAVSDRLLIGWQDDGRWQGLLGERLREFTADRSLRRRLSLSERALVDGKGATRVAAKVRKLR